MIGITLVPESPKTQQCPHITLLQQRPTYCEVNSTFEMSVYSKEYTFSILFCMSEFRAGTMFYNP